MELRKTALTAEGLPVDQPEEGYVVGGREPCLGRRGPLSLLERLLQSLPQASKAVVIRGEPGIGKTRLVQEFAERAKQQGVRVAWGHCYGLQEPPPYLPFQQALEGLRMSRFWGEQEAVSAGESEIAGNAPALLGRDPAEDRRRFLTQVARQLLSEAERQQLMLVVEDIHWADTASLLLLNHVVDLEGRGLALVCTVREGEDPPDAARKRLLFMLERKSRVLKLGGLGREAVRGLVRWLCGTGVGAEREIEAVRSFTGGNPLFVREVVAHLRDGRFLEIHGLAQALQEVPLPSRLAGMLDLRIESLPARTRAVLDSAGVLGTEFSLESLAAVSSMAAGEIADAVFEATERGILQPLGAPVAQRFGFAHPLYQKHLYEHLRPSRRQELHARIARAVVRREIHLPSEELATHCALGAEPHLKGKAVGLCREAAEKAERLFAYETAAQYWRFAIRCLPPRNRRCRAELLGRLAWACWSGRMWGQARDAWEQAISLLESVGDRGRVGLMALALGETARWQQDLDAADRWLERALDELPPDSGGVGRALALLGDVACVRNQTEHGLSLLHKARQHSLAAGTTDPHVLHSLSFGYLNAGDVDKAREFANEGLRSAVATDNLRAQGLLAGLLVQIELSLLNLAGARQFAAIVRQVASPTDATALMFSLVSRCFLLAYRGSWELVARTCERGMAELRLAGQYQESTLRFMRAEALLSLGNPRAACIEMAEALPGLHGLHHVGRVHLARALLRMGESSLAHDVLAHYVAAAVSTPRMAVVRAVLAEIASHAGTEEQCRTLYKRLAQESRPLLLLYSPIATQRVLGRVAAKLGDWRSAQDHFENAVAQLSSAGAAWELIRTYLDYAEFRRARRRRGDATRALALEAEAGRLLDKLGVQASALGWGRPSSETEARVNRFGLTGREVEVLRLLAGGQRSSEMAEALGISPRTVERHLENIFSKMGVRGRVEAVVLAVEEGLISGMASG